ncbi:MAG: dehydrogenase [Actinomycetia bacterium]|nr:dehydrogenase [Actinomycetes bacterium]
MTTRTTSDLGFLQVGPARLTRGFDTSPRVDWPTHLSLHGQPQALSTDQLVALAEAGRLHGRGGAAFPFWRKVKAVADSAIRRKTRTIVVVNATEGEPGSHKDKLLMRRAPHLILDGAAITATALGAKEIFVGATEDRAAASMEQAITERGMDTRVRVVRLPERFITGESGALIRGINGHRPIPPGRKRRAYESGVGGLPTMLSNAETYAQLAVLASLGPREYRSVGTLEEPGTVLLTVTGAARYPAVIETPAGAPLAHLLDLCGASVGEGVLMGGYHGAFLGRAAVGAARVSRESLNALGATLGAGIIMPLGRRTCPLGEAARVAQYLGAESAGQCGPCRLGLPDIANALGEVVAGRGSAAALDTLHRAVRMVRGRGACSHPDGVSRFVISAIETFTADLAAHQNGGGCGRPVLGLLTVEPNPDAKLRLEVDWSRCDGHGLCADILKGTVRMDEYDYPVIPEGAIPLYLEADARKAVAMCPGLALRLVKRQ